jgi:hypothetical protein
VKWVLGINLDRFIVAVERRHVLALLEIAHAQIVPRSRITRREKSEHVTKKSEAQNKTR